MKPHYWSCSKLADWIRGTPTLAAGTSEEWLAWKKKAKSKKFRYWLAEEFLDHLQNFIYWPTRRIYDVRCYVNNRWRTQSHALVSNLKKGQWYDLDTCLIHAIFDELINFVEIEQAWMNVVFSEENRKKYKTPWYRTVFRMGVWRCPEAGIAHLEWAAGLKYDEDYIDKNDPKFGQLTSQALAAQEILALYKWWKIERPKRLDPSDASGWSAYCDKKHKTAEARGDNSLLSIFNKDNEEEKKISRNLLDIYHTLEEEQEEEDTAMLIRLIKIRRNLWT